MKKRVINDGALEIYDEDGRLLLSVKGTMKDGGMDVKLRGSIVTEAAHDFEDELFAFVTVCRKIAIDFAGVTHISSMGLKTLLELQRILDKTEDGALRFYHVSSDVYAEFQHVGFDELFLIETA